jgi:flavin reductase (DIM6/NTAB) family NADH-FMN oxidoreductase RutF
VLFRSNQVALSRNFSSTKVDRFAGIAWDPGMGGAPLLAGCAAHFECRNQVRHHGGDHIIFVGQVERYAIFDRHSLMFSRGHYHRIGRVAED